MMELEGLAFMVWGFDMPIAVALLKHMSGVGLLFLEPVTGSLAMQYDRSILPRNYKRINKGRASLRGQD
jgi:hypothetical protein